MALEKKDKAEAKSSAAVYKRKYDEARTAYFRMESPEEFNKRIMADVTARTVKMGVNLEDVASVRLEANEQMAAYQLKFEAARKEMEQAKHLLDVWKGVTKELERQEEFEKKKEELERKQVEAKRKSAQEDAATFARRAIGAGQVNATERFMIDVMHDRKKSPLTQFTMIGKELDDLREQRNKKLEEAYGLNRQIQKEVSTAKPERLDELSKARGLAMEQADFLGRRIDVLEGALKDITNKVVAPDFSHMTSLAQYGFNMGEDEDTDRVMQDYYGKMTDLTKQIRDKLDQGIKTQATYSE